MIRKLSSIALKATAILLIGWVTLALYGTNWFLSRYVWNTLNPPAYDYKSDLESIFKDFGLSIAGYQSMLGFNTGYNPGPYALLNALEGTPYVRPRRINRVQRTAQVFRIDAASSKIIYWREGIQRYCQQVGPTNCEVQKAVSYQSVDASFWGIGQGSTTGALMSIHGDSEKPTYRFWFDSQNGIALIKKTYKEREFGRTYNYVWSRTLEELKSRRSDPRHASQK